MKYARDLTSYQLKTVQGFLNASYNDALVYISSKISRANAEGTKLNPTYLADAAWEYSKKNFESRCRRHEWFVPYDNVRLSEYLDDFVRGHSSEHKELVAYYKAKKQILSEKAELQEIKSLVSDLKRLCDKQGLKVKIEFEENTEDESD